MNDDKVNKYCQATLYPYHKFIHVGCNKYSGDNSETLCYNVIGLVAVSDQEKEEWCWYDKVVAITNKKFTDMRSNKRGSCHKQYKSETV